MKKLMFLAATCMVGLVGCGQSGGGYGESESGSGTSYTPPASSSTPSDVTSQPADTRNSSDTLPGSPSGTLSIDTNNVANPNAGAPAPAVQGSGDLTIENPANESQSAPAQEVQPDANADVTPNQAIPPAPEQGANSDQNQVQQPQPQP